MIKEGCRYNTCSICGFATDCEIYKAYTKQKEINKEQVDELEKHSSKIVQLEEDVAVLNVHLRG